MKKFHIAIGVSDVAKSVEDYSKRLECEPTLVIPEQYALWRTDTLNFSIRKVSENPGALRHLGLEDPAVSRFTEDKDVNGIVWERFNAGLQAQEIQAAWPAVRGKMRVKGG